MAEHLFLVNVGALRHGQKARIEVERCGCLAGVRVSGSELVEGREVCVDVALEAVHGGIMATGTVTGEWRGECRRCLGEASGAIDTAVRELFEEDHDPEETYPLEGDQIDLEPLARDAVLLELPQAPLCSEECRGLCAECGANLNEIEGEHAHAQVDPRWAALDVLRSEQDETNE